MSLHLNKNLSSNAIAYKLNGDNFNERNKLAGETITPNTIFSRKSSDISKMNDKKRVNAGTYFKNLLQSNTKMGSSCQGNYD